MPVPLYKVFFNEAEIFRSKTIEDALAFALSLHRSSNVNHVIGVLAPDSDLASITLKLGEDV